MNRCVHVLGSLILGSLVGSAAVVYQESVQGDFSDNYLAPTPLTLGAGSNVIEGSLTGASLDLDLFTITVPRGTEVRAIRVIEFSGGLSGSFMGTHVGSTMTEAPLQYIRFNNGEIFSVDPINYVIFGELDAVSDRDVLPQLVVGRPIGGDFRDPKLTEGQYAFWLNETRAASSYTLDFELVSTPIPEPSVLLLGILGLGYYLGRRVRK